MSYIAPNSDIVILKGVPLDNDYLNTLKQDSVNSQYNMFYAFKKYELSNYNYQRSDKGTIKVDILCDNLYDCNYMMFRNTNFGSKWFYAFITGRTFINDKVTEIQYEIDVMQTWYFDYTMEHCYVEREHTETDLIGDNLVPENFDTGNLIPEQLTSFVFPDDVTSPSGVMYELVVFYVPNNSKSFISSIYLDSSGSVQVVYEDCKDSDTGNYDTGAILNGIYMGCKFFGIPMLLDSAIGDTLALINGLIAAIGKDDVNGTIVNIAQIPYSLWSKWLQQGSAEWHKLVTEEERFYNAPHTKSFIPKNKKLYTYPYRQLEVSNNGGDKATYRWENFNATYEEGGGEGEIGKATLTITGVPVLSPELMCYPARYNSLQNDYESGIMLIDFPNPPWSVDSYSRWMAQNKDAIMYSALATSVLAIGGALATVATGGALAPVAGTAVAGYALNKTLNKKLFNAGMSINHEISNDITSAIKAKNMPDQFKGQLNISSLRTIQHRVGYYMYDMGVEYSVAKTIDDYFNMFGYAIREVKVPNIRRAGATLRPHWNYIKTNGCILHPATGSGLSAEDEKDIAQIYDKGITFWNYPYEVGKYELDNSPSDTPVIS